jgi:hypothetical protein
MPRPNLPTEQESVASLVARLGADVSRIVRAEIALVQTRIAATLQAVRTAAVLLVLGALLALGGFGALVFALVLVVAQWMGAWQAAFAVAGGLLVVGGGLLALQVRLLTDGVREALSEVHLDVRRVEDHRGE